MDDLSYYRLEADRCRRLARMIPGDRAAQRLLGLADDFDAKAESSEPGRARREAKGAARKPH